MATNSRQTKAERQQGAREKARQMQEEQRRQEKRRSLMVRWGVVLGVVVVVAVVVGVIFMNSSRSIPDAGPAPSVGNEHGGVVMTSTTELASSDFGGQQVDASTVEVPESTGEQPTSVPGAEERGAGDPAQVIIYADANCVHCAQFEAENGEQINEWLDSGKATVEYRLLDFLDNPATGNYSSRAANAALCVAEESPEDYNAFVAEIFAGYTGEGMDDDELKSMASGLGADIDGCVDGNTYRPYVKYTGAQARAAGVVGTPTVWVNGENWASAAEQGQSFTDWATSVMEKTS
ncbi:hypothetical protein E7744_12040 [Citricoccus sp. SGAir0253]|uniref:DsbA family protein n=1 Tax=Citricoccus sp. SGAir0253 TaxID=2567881 RepID=UPI0010CD66FF|nr:thioredoxin domain-containing protein [Citricoccus sp. SGAir0253]QCU78788.1 hypothetical protein E7744_12040 [Citricoccus sp. SGAir0253]